MEIKKFQKFRDEMVKQKRICEYNKEVTCYPSYAYEGCRRCAKRWEKQGG